MSNSIKSVSVLRQIAYPPGLFSNLSWGVAIIALSGLALLLLPQVAGGETGTIPATVEIKTQLTITKTADLNFGQIRAGQSNGIVIVTPLNVRTAVDVTLRALTNFSRATFIITGDSGTTYNIAPVLDFALHDKRGDPVLGVTLLEVTNLKSYSTTVKAETLIGKFNNNGIDSVFVGGTLLVPQGAKFGKYGGQVTLTINF